MQIKILGRIITITNLCEHKTEQLEYFGNASILTIDNRCKKCGKFIDRYYLINCPKNENPYLINHIHTGDCL